MATLVHDRVTKEDASFCNCARIGKGKECYCGEEEKQFTWFWDPHSTQSDATLQDNGREVIFHANYSSGTAAIRGDTPFHEGHYFWEVKMTTPVYGTDMMVGVATPELELDKYVHTFCSLLGRDQSSWGLSYMGTAHHNNQSKPFSDKMGQGAIVGVHLDMWQGTLAFYLNRRPLGVAYRGLQGKTLYPVVTSTAARSGMKVITTKWFPHSLQFQCCQTLRSCVTRDKYVLDAVSLPPGLNTFLQNNLGWLLRSYSCPSFPPTVVQPFWLAASPVTPRVSEEVGAETRQLSRAQHSQDEQYDGGIHARRGRSHRYQDDYDSSREAEGSSSSGGESDMVEDGSGDHGVKRDVEGDFPSAAPRCMGSAGSTRVLRKRKRTEVSPSPEKNDSVASDSERASFRSSSEASPGTGGTRDAGSHSKRIKTRVKGGKRDDTGNSSPPFKRRKKPRL